MREGGFGDRGLTKSLADAGADSEVRNIVVVHHIEVHHVSAYIYKKVVRGCENVQV